MEERQQDIQVGAGQLEGKLNEEFIGWLKKFGVPLLWLVLVGAFGYWGYGRWQAGREVRVAEAFRQLESSRESGSPDALLAVAADFSDVGSVAELARLDAADVHLSAFRRGVAPGATLDQDGTIIDLSASKSADPNAPKPQGLTDQERQTHLDKARSLFEQVLAGTKGDSAKALHAINALFGLAAVAECKGDLAAAGEAYKQASDRSTAAGFKDLASIAADRIKTLDSVKEAPKLLRLADLPKPPTPAPVTPTPGAPAEITLPDGTKMQRMDGPPPGVTPPAASAPAPKPAEPTNPPAGSPAAPAAPPTPPPATPPATPPTTPPANPPSTPPGR